MDNQQFQEKVIEDLATIKEQLKPMQKHLDDSPKFRDTVITHTNQFTIVEQMIKSVECRMVWLWGIIGVCVLGGLVRILMGGLL